MTRFRGSLYRRLGTIVLITLLVFVSAGCAKNRASVGVTSYDVFAQKFKYQGMGASIPAGNFQLNFSNRESFPIVHELIVAALPSGQTVDDVIASAKVAGCTGGGECESQYLHFGEIGDVETGATISQVFNLPAGTYIFACWQQGTPEGTEDGPTHASIGMVQTFTVT